MARTSNGKYIGRAAQTEKLDFMRELSNATTRDNALNEIKSLSPDVEKYHQWFNALYDSTKAKGDIEAYDKAILQKLADLQSEAELTADIEWLNSHVELDEGELLPTREIPNSSCPNCGSPLRVNNKRNYMTLKTRRQFVGCMSYPKCGYIARNISQEVILTMRQVQVTLDVQPVEIF